MVGNINSYVVPQWFIKHVTQMPSRQVLKEMVEDKYEEEETKAQLQSLTLLIWMHILQLLVIMCVSMQSWSQYL